MAIDSRGKGWGCDRSSLFGCKSEADLYGMTKDFYFRSTVARQRKCRALNVAVRSAQHARTKGLVASRSRFIRPSFGLLGLGLLCMLGCAPLQHTMPALSPFVVGIATCPHCGLQPGKGCPCHPDAWTHGYHATVWRPMYWAGADEYSMPEEILAPVPQVDPAVIVPDEEPPAPPE